MNDPFDILRGRLVDAARRRGSRRRRRSGVAILATALLLGSCAAATALMLTREPSKPLRGSVPGSDMDYTIELRPDLTPGSIGWCVSVAFRRGGTPVSFGSGCAPAPPPERAQIVGVGGAGPNGGIVGVVVDQRVTTVQLPDGRRITSRADRGVPSTMKIAVAGLRGEPRAVETRLLDRRGRRLPNQNPPDSWAAGTHRLPTRTVDPANPPNVRCAIHYGRLQRLRPISARVVSRFPAAPPGVAEPALLSCGGAVYSLGRTRLTAAVLVDPADASAQAPLLPGMPSEPAPGAITVANSLLSAKRAGPGWLAVFGGTARERERLLAVLSTST